jgi:hypothetical protein
MERKINGISGVCDMTYIMDGLESIGRESIDSVHYAVLYCTDFTVLLEHGIPTLAFHISEQYKKHRQHFTLHSI